MAYVGAARYLTFQSAGPLLIVAVVLSAGVAGVAGGWAAKRLHVPGITGNIIAGVLLGPYFLGLFGNVSVPDLLQPLTTFAMGIISVGIGGACPTAGFAVRCAVSP